MNNDDNDVIKPGKKLPEKYDDPIDLFYADICDIIMPYFKSAGFTPNMITTISFIFGLISCYLYYIQNYVLASISYIISYFFDVMDGIFARKYNMKSKFGSYYDLYSDFIVLFILIYLVLTNKNFIKLKYINIKILFIIFLFIYSIVSLYHFTCQESYVRSTAKHNSSEALQNRILTCMDHKHMRITRFFGPGINSCIIPLFIFVHIFLTKKK
jgi:phosphatidylglycerophosphate synthase